MQKRVKFVIVTFVLLLGFMCIQLLEERFRLTGIVGLSVLTTLLFSWSLHEGLGRNSTLSVLVLPALYTLGVGLFWFLLPATLMARIPAMVVYSVGVYGLGLTANIFTVGAIRTIALVRAAKGVGFVLTLFTAFLLFDGILSLRQTAVLSSGLVALVSLPLFYQSLWTVKLEKEIDTQIVVMALLLSLSVVEISLLLSFWPVSVVVGSLFLTVWMYVILGLAQSRLEQRLFSQTVREYAIVGVLVFLAMFLATSWGA